MKTRTVSTGEMLKAEIVGDRLRIEIGLNALAFACEHAPNLEHYNEATGEFEHPVVTDPEVFAKEVLRALNREEEDGTTPVHRLLDAAYEEAIDHGAEGVKMPGDDQ